MEDYQRALVRNYAVYSDGISDVSYVELLVYIYFIELLVH